MLVINGVTENEIRVDKTAVDEIAEDQRVIDEHQWMK